MKAQTMYPAIMATLVATFLTGIATLFWSTGQELPAWQPTALAIQDLWTAIAEKADAHRLVGETAQWYGVAILVASFTVTAIISTVARAIGIRPLSTRGWLTYTIGLPIVATLTALYAMMLLPYLIDANQVFTTAPIVEMSHFTSILIALQAFLMECAQIAINGWNWWVWAAINILINLPLIGAALIIKAKHEREEGVYMYILQA